MKCVEVQWHSAADYLNEAFSRGVSVELPIDDDNDRYEVVKAHARMPGKWFELRGSRSIARVQTHESARVDIYLYHIRR